MTIGSKIKNLRKSRKLTQEDFSKKIGVSRSTLSCYEIGQRTPSLKTLSEIAEIFGIGLDYFGLSAKDEAFDLLARAKEVFENDNIPDQTKEELYHEFMKLYLAMKELNRNDNLQ
jgi:transcriptional regulator with XRE-family HTH domain